MFYQWSPGVLADYPLTEEKLALYIVHWAKEHGFHANRDKVGNVFIRKQPAWPITEDIPVVMLQAHMDMVCVKRNGSSHDFMKDSIPWVIKGDTLSTGGEITLGADNGIGVALAMALLEVDEPNLPALEVLLTVMEDELLCGSCGGMRADFHLPLTKKVIPEGWKRYVLQISGLAGAPYCEGVSISSVRRMFKYLQYILNAICSQDGTE